MAYLNRGTQKVAQRLKEVLDYSVSQFSNISKVDRVGLEHGEIRAGSNLVFVKHEGRWFCLKDRLV